MFRLLRKTLPATLISLAGSLPFALAASAATQPPSGSEDMPQAFSGLDSFYMMLKVIGVLIVLILLFFILVRLLARRQQASSFGRPLRSVGGLPLGQNKSLQLVLIGKSLYVIGVGDNVQLLDKIADEAEIAELTSHMAGEGGGFRDMMSVGTWLRQLRERQKHVEEEELNTSSFGHLFQEKLQEIASSKKSVQDRLQQRQSDEERFNPK